MEQNNFKKIIIVSLITLLVGGLVAGGVVYFWQKSEKETKENELNEQIKILENQKQELESLNQELQSQEANTEEAIQEDTETSENSSSPTRTGYISRAYIEGGKRYIEMDYIELLEGDEAQAAAFADGECPILNDQCAPNGTYVRNENSQKTTLEVKDGITVKLAKQFFYSEDGIRYVGFEDQFITYIDSDENASPFTVKVENQKVTEISEIFIP